jgi:diketogulonate reductase-like aldo/keto reductase
MEELVAQGKCKSIGVSNFNISQLQELLKVCKIKPVVNQFEVHPYYQNEALVKFCQENDIIATAYAPLGAPDRGWYFI